MIGVALAIKNPLRKINVVRIIKLMFMFFYFVNICDLNVVIIF